MLLALKVVQKWSKYNYLAKIYIFSGKILNYQNFFLEKEPLLHSWEENNEVGWTEVLNLFELAAYFATKKYLRHT